MILNEAQYDYEVVTEDSNEYTSTWTEHAFRTQNGQKYSIKSELKWEPTWQAKMDISEVYPYDLAEYTWARLYDDSIKFVRNGKVVLMDTLPTNMSLGHAIDSAYKAVEAEHEEELEMDDVLELIMTEPEYMEFITEFFEDAQEYIIDKLEVLNEDVEPEIDKT